MYFKGLTQKTTDRCIFGHLSTRDKSKLDKSPPTYAISSCVKTGIICNCIREDGTVCNRLSCYSCLDKIHKKLTPAHISSDMWCGKVHEIISNGPDLEKNISFLGSCCEYQHIPKDLTNLNQLTTPSYDFDLHRYFFLPEYSILLEPSFDSIDAHVIGPDHFLEMEGVYHAVINTPMDGSGLSGKDTFMPVPLRVIDIDVSNVPNLSPLISNYHLFGKQEIKVEIFSSKRV